MDEQHAHTRWFEELNLKNRDFDSGESKMVNEDSGMSISQSGLGGLFSLGPEGRMLVENQLGGLFSLGPEGRILAGDQVEKGYKLGPVGSAEIGHEELHTQHGQLGMTIMGKSRRTAGRRPA